MQDSGLHGLNNFTASFDFSNSEQLQNLPSHGTNPSYIVNEKLYCPIDAGEHKGLGRKFYFAEHGGEPDEAEMEFEIWMDSDFQKEGVDNECSKFPGFEGIYDRNAGWGGKTVTTQNSWSVRIGHLGENSAGEIPLALYVYHPYMPHKYGTTEILKYSISREETHKFKLYIRLNDIGKENGIMILYVDNKEIYNSNKWLFRLKPEVHIKSVWLDAYIGGWTPSKADTYVLLDNLKIKW